MTKKPILVFFNLLTSTYLFASALQPTPKASANKPDEEPPPIETITDVKGLETTKFSESDIGAQGNWRKKNAWLRQAQAKNYEIQQALTNIQNAQKDFSQTLHNLNGLFDNFYQETGFDKGKVEQFFADLTKEIEESKEKTRKLFSQTIMHLDEQTRNLAAEIKKQYADLESIDEAFKKRITTLEQLKFDMKAIIDLDQSVRDRSRRFDEQIQTGQTLAEQATTLSEKIWHIIDDQKARQIFYDLHSINEKIKALQLYLTVDLIQDLASVVETIKNQITKTKDSIDTVEKFGIIVANRMIRLEQMRKDKEQVLAQQVKEKQKHPPQKAPKRNVSWYTMPINLFLSLLENIKTFFIAIYEILFTKT